ncbi:IS2 element protein [Klebsiella pneumoniae]|nr:IS2 element protein [Klebsiella pneumoniae]SLY24847.1 IS2 element protein [Klebsiella pneumoniae]SLY25610.1 IS2 element protein [Klebsiella pneumoniae]SLY25686.1 IS2 element protein [Klebsiella pneumoniae]SMB58943.1 IS2 element protein [Klebsiella pneumoniae]
MAGEGILIQNVVYLFAQDRRRRRKSDDTEALARIHTVIGDLPTYGYRRVWALLCSNQKLTTWR